MTANSLDMANDPQERHSIAAETVKTVCKLEELPLPSMGNLVLGFERQGFMSKGLLHSRDLDEP